MLHDFTAMRKIGARNVITFDICGDGMDTSYYGREPQSPSLVLVVIRSRSI